MVHEHREIAHKIKYNPKIKFMKKELHARKHALNHLMNIVHEQDMMPIHIDSLSEQDNTFCLALVRTTLRHLGQLDHIMDSFMDTPLKMHSMERMLLRLGMCQLVYMDSVKDHAAINTTVDLAKATGKHKAAGLLNALLRRCQKEGKQVLRDCTPDKRMAPWLAAQLQKDFGKERFNAFAPHMNAPAALHINLFDDSLNNEYEDFGCPIKGLTNAWHITERGVSVSELPNWDAGDAYAQDAAAQIPAYLVKHFLADKQDAVILDMCAAPGGKSVQLHKTMPNAQITSIDNNPERNEKVKENFARCHVDGKIMSADATATGFEDASYDAILLDAPCSATGTSKRHPEVLWNKTLEQVDELINLQQQMMVEADRLLKPNGILVYATCSLLKMESENQAAAFQKEFDGYELLPLTADMFDGRDDFITTNGMLRCLPQMGMDGFFSVVLRKK